MALIHAKTEQYEKALQIFRSILRSQDARFGPDSEQSTQTKGMVGFMLFKMMEIDEGLKRLRNVSNWQDERLPAAHPSVHATKHIIQIAEDHLAGKTSVWI